MLLTKKSLPLLKKSKEGAIMNISSGYGYIAMPFYSVYAATKAAVRQFSDAMEKGTSSISFTCDDSVSFSYRY
ncbi:SDR family NAD(P)-dependent oxidoreductase [Antarcticibacterium sp. 1MA-6-2]|uniref:SDR family NAD(P)-dependent oxidoreductase n=1 Tax=Antarcticibacterium sp. 1MA-6-2 TaxID=2908210 RepID=UPI002882FBD9|nr:SDR family NAD(P)-dependent oxidoreductase [Antarcticibacterium sp. 1MA-6-2]